MNFTIKSAVGPFAVGDSLNVYVAPVGIVPSNTQPTSSVVTAGTVQSDGTVPLTGLTANTRYVAGKTVDSVWRQIGFTTVQTVSPFDRSQGQPGVYAPSGALGSAPSANGLTAGRLYCSRFVPARDLGVTKMAFGVSTAAGANDPMFAAIYAATGSGLLVAQSASLLGLLTSTGVKVATITASLSAGSAYFAALFCPAYTSTAANVYLSALLNTNLAQLFGSTLENAEYLSQTGLAALPADLSGAAAATSGCHVAVREV